MYIQSSYQQQFKPWLEQIAAPIFGQLKIIMRKNGRLRIVVAEFISIAVKTSMYVHNIDIKGLAKFASCAQRPFDSCSDLKVADQSRIMKSGASDF
jgi:hypothetical protein